MLSIPNERERIMEMMVNTNKFDEFLCEEIIDKLQTDEGNNQTAIQLLEHITDIDFLCIAKALYSEYVVS